MNQMLMNMCYMKMPTKQLKTEMDSDMKSKTQYNMEIYCTHC